MTVQTGLDCGIVLQSGPSLTVRSDQSIQNLPAPTQQAALQEAEDNVMRSRRATNIDADSRIIEALEAEARSRAQID